MGKLRHGAGLALETADEHWVIEKLVVHDLRRHRAAQAEVDAAIHRGHSTPGNGVIHAVAILNDVPDLKCVHAV